MGVIGTIINGVSLANKAYSAADNNALLSEFAEMCLVVLKSEDNDICLKKVANAHIKAAEKTLREIIFCNDKKSMLQQALPSLKEAFYLYYDYEQSILTNPLKFNFYKVILIIKPDIFRELFEHKIKICFLIVSIYEFLGESNSLINEWEETIRLCRSVGSSAIYDRILKRKLRLKYDKVIKKHLTFHK